MGQLCAIVRFRKEETRLFCEYSFVPAQFSTQGQTITVERDFPLTHIEETLVAIQKHLRFREITPSPRTRRVFPAAYVIDIAGQEEDAVAVAIR